MPGRYQGLLWAFIGLTLFHLWAEYSQHQLLIYLSKPALLSLLSLYFFLNLKNNVALSAGSSRSGRWILAGLIFSIGGDTLLLFVELGDL